MSRRNTFQNYRLRFLAYGMLFCLAAGSGLWMRLLFISRPISPQDAVLGAKISREEFEADTITLASYSTLDQKNQDVPDLARHWLLIDGHSNQILAEKNAQVSVPIASTAKIMTGLLTIENIPDLNQIVTVKHYSLNVYQSNQRLLWGDEYRIIDLLYLMLLESDNQAANVLADFVGQKVATSPSPNNNFTEAFVKLMNVKARDLGLLHTHFVDPAGLDPNTRSSPIEISFLALEALKNDTFQKIVSTAETDISNISKTRFYHLKNTNRLVSEWHYPGIIGVKTGFLPNSSQSLSAGHCLIAAAQRNGHLLVAGIFNTYSELNTASATAAKALLDYGFEHTRWF